MPLPNGGVLTSADAVGTRPRLAIAYDITSSSPMELVSMIDGVCEIVWVVDVGNPSLGSMSRLLPRLGQVVDTEGRGADDVAELLQGQHLDGVIAFTDTQLLLASAIGGHLGLPSNPPHVVDRLNDKYAQRQALANAGITVPGFQRIPGVIGAQPLAELVGSLSFPLVLKPLHGGSSWETWLIGDLPTLLGLFETRFSGDHFASVDFIAEEYLVGTVPPELQSIGDYVSVESIVQDGRPTPVAITGKFPLAEPFRESGNFMPHLLMADEAAAVLALSVDAAAALEVKCGALHTEIKLTPDGPRVIEVNGRIGGGGIDSIFKRTRGHSLTQLAATVALGHDVELIADTPQSHSGPFVYEFFVQPPMAARRLRSIDGVEGLVGVVGAHTVVMNRSPGNDIDWHEGSQGYLLQVGGVAPDLATLSSVPKAILESIDITFE